MVGCTWSLSKVGTGAGKGEAVRILTRIFRKMAFTGIIKTHQPRRTSTFGKLAMDAVRQGDRTPIEEAGLFIADRLDHSIGSILPDLERGHLVISDRNIHSSLVYQGLVGGVGVEQVLRSEQRLRSRTWSSGWIVTLRRPWRESVRGP